MPELDIKEFLKGDDVGKEREFKIVDEGKAGLIKGGEGKPDVKTFEITVIAANQDAKIWTMNMTSQRTLATKWGKNTAEWVGKIATLYSVDMNVRGTPKKVIYARLPAE